MSDLPTVISATRRQYRELVDGTIEVRLHIDPRFKADFHRLFPSIDTPCALAPLALDFEKLSKYPEEQKGGELARLAGMWSKDPLFWEWLKNLYKSTGRTIPDFNETSAANWIRATCGVSSRSEIDHIISATELFHKNIRVPFNSWLKRETQ